LSTISSSSSPYCKFSITPSKSSSILFTASALREQGLNDSSTNYKILSLIKILLYRNFLANFLFYCYSSLRFYFLS
jgi:hypothetical protein